MCAYIKYAKTWGNNIFWFGSAERRRFIEENSRKKKEIHKLSLFNKVVIGLILAAFLCCLISIPFTIKSRKLSEQAINVVKEI